MARIKKLNFVVLENISAANSRRWFTQERAASLARLTIVIGLHVLVLAGLFSWSWSPTPIEVSILTLQDLEGDTPKTEDSQVQEPVQPSIAATQVPSAESIETEQIDIALTQQSQPEPESAVQSRLEAPPESRPFTVPAPVPKPVQRAAVPQPTATGAAAAANSTANARQGSDAEQASTAARFDADYLHNPAPTYPSQSRRLKEEGTVLLLVRVSADGAPAEIEVRQSSGFERLDEAALQAVRQWRFVPAKRGSQNVAASVIVPIQFKRQ